MSAPRPRPLPPTAALLLLLAGLIVGSDLLLALLGGRAATSLLTGTSPGDAGQLLLGALYVATHLGAVLLAPALALAAVIRLALERAASGPARG